MVTPIPALLALGFFEKEEYKEIFKLKKLLEKAKIPFIFKKLDDYRKGYQILYPVEGIENRCSVIEHIYSYGHDKDLLEIMGLLTDEEVKHDSVVGYLSAENVFHRIYRDFKERGNEYGID